MDAANEQSTEDISAQYDRLMSAMKGACIAGDLLAIQYLAQAPIAKITEEMFVISCSRGNLAVCQWVATKVYISKPVLQTAFTNACLYGHLGVAQYVSSTFQVIMPHKVLADVCVTGRLDIVQWLFKKFGTPPHHTISHIFIELCKFSHLGLIQWMYEQASINVTTLNNAFINACNFGHLDVAQWITTLGCDKLDAYYLVQRFHNLAPEIAQWINRLGFINDMRIAVTKMNLEKSLACKRLLEDDIEQKTNIINNGRKQIRLDTGLTTIGLTTIGLTNNDGCQTLDTSDLGDLAVNPINHIKSSNDDLEVISVSDDQLNSSTLSLTEYLASVSAELSLESLLEIL